MEVFLVIVGGIFVLICYGVFKSKQNTARSTALSNVPDFRPMAVYKGMPGDLHSSEVWVAIDPDRNKFAISRGTQNPRVFGFSDLVGVEVLRNGASLQKTNRGSQIAGAAVGAVLLGPVGLLLGGLTGSKRVVETIDKLSLKIFTNDLGNPVHEIVFLKSPGSKPDSFLVKQASKELDNWHARFQTILASQR